MYRISIATPYFEYQADVDEDLVMYDDVEAYIRENFWLEIIGNIVDQYGIKPAGFFENVLEIGEGLYSFVEKEILSAERAVAICSELADSQEVVSTKEYQLKGLLLEIMEERGSAENFSVDTGSVVEASLMEFIDSSFWHYGLWDKNSGSVIEDPSRWPVPIATEHNIVFCNDKTELTPVLWFGPKGKPPTKRWMIGLGDTDQIQFWFDYDYLMENLQGAPDQMFLVWYIYECGMYVPDIDEIRECCPVSISESDTPEQLAQKISIFIASKLVSNDCSPEFELQ